ncbi:FeoA family protein [Treponema primitia]|uniref:FeoA family protein n=1 Tax=Treponema primitia TaxID=88058 RepID=UPI000318B0B3|nr:FeoA family protein [Treponema primitia]
MVLSDAPNGASFRVVKVALRKEVGKRLADMGFTEDAEGAVVRSGFFRGPLQVRIRGYDILIRRDEAGGIEVLPVGDWSAVKDAGKILRRKKIATRNADFSRQVPRAKLEPPPKAPETPAKLPAETCHAGK